MSDGGAGGAALRAYGLLGMAALLWGGNAVAGRLAVGHVSPLLLTSLRWAACSLAAAALGAGAIRRDREVLRRHAGMLFAYGAVGFTLFNAFLYSAAQYTTALNIVILQAATPLVIFTLSFAACRARVSAAQALGFLVTLAGVLVTVSAGRLETLLSLRLNRGDGLMLGAVVFYGAYAVGLRWKPRLHWLSFLAAISAGAFLASLPLAAWELARGATIWPDARGWGVVAYAAFLPGLVAQSAFIAGAAALGGNRAGLFMNLVPVFGALASLAVLGERLAWYHVVGLGLALGGLALAERRPRAG